MLTAAHCLDPYIVGMVGLPRFTLDDDAEAEAAVLVEPDRAILHEGYVSQVEFHIYLESPHDVALLVLADAITDVEPSPIATAADVPTNGLELELVGYGQTIAGDPGTVGVEYFAPVTVTEVGDTELRFAGVGAPTPCVGSGDSGGPTFADDRVTTVTSHAGTETLCGGNGDIGERVDVYASWIIEQAPSVCDVTPSACPPAPDAGPMPDADDDPGVDEDDAGGCCGTGTSPASAVALLVLVTAVHFRARHTSGCPRRPR